MLKSAIKSAFSLLGLNVQWRNRLAEQIPAAYPTSPFLPRLYLPTVKRLLYFHEMVERVRKVPGDFVECGVSIGHGLLCFILLHEIAGVDRGFFGFDSFEGFPAPSAKDGKTHVYEGFYSSAPEIVQHVLADGRVPEKTRRECVTLVKGFFDKTLPSFDHPIAMLHLDCDIYESYKTALEHLYNRVVPGGVILFDEYEDPHYPGAKRAIDEYFFGSGERLEQHRFGKYFMIKAS